MSEMIYKDYTGSVEQSETGFLYGKICYIDDLVTYEGKTPEELNAEFQKSVDVYLETCKQAGKEPENPFGLKGRHLTEEEALRPHLPFKSFTPSAEGWGRYIPPGPERENMKIIDHPLLDEKPDFSMSTGGYPVDWSDIGKTPQLTSNERDELCDVRMKPFGGFNGIKLKYAKALVKKLDDMTFVAMRLLDAPGEFKLAWIAADTKKMAELFTNSIFDKLHFPLGMSMTDILGEPVFASKEEEEQFPAACHFKLPENEDLAVMTRTCAVTAAFKNQLRMEGERTFDFGPVPGNCPGNGVINPVEEAPKYHLPDSIPGCGGYGVMHKDPITSSKLSDIIVDLLHAQLYITDEQVDAARKFASSTKCSVVIALQQLYGISEEELMMMVASVYGMETFDYNGYTIPKEAIDAIPGAVARKYEIAPVSKNGDVLTIAISDPSDLNLLDSINKALGSVDVVVTTPRQIKMVIDRIYDKQRLLQELARTPEGREQIANAMVKGR
jgi:hypothetical protein